MTAHPYAMALATCFVAGCLLIDALQARAEDVTLVLLLVLIVLANLACGLLLSALAPAFDAVPALERIEPAPAVLREINAASRTPP